jgi:hypothetical protein
VDKERTAYLYYLQHHENNQDFVKNGFPHPDVPSLMLMSKSERENHFKHILTNQETERRRLTPPFGAFPEPLHCGRLSISLPFANFRSLFSQLIGWRKSYPHHRFFSVSYAYIDHLSPASCSVYGFRYEFNTSFLAK